MPVIFAYGGWQTATFVAGEIKEPRKNLPRGLILGVSRRRVALSGGKRGLHQRPGNSRTRSVKSACFRRDAKRTRRFRRAHHRGRDRDLDGRLF